MDLQPQSGRFNFEVTHTGTQVTGSISPSRLSPFVSLQSFSQGSWQGQVGQQIASTEVQDLGNGRTRVTISALPGGWYTYTVKSKSNGDVEVNGTGPQGNLNSAGIKKSGSEVYFFNQSFSYDLSSDGNSRYEGSVVSGGSNSGFGYLSVDGDLAPLAVVADPALFIILYVLPFSQ